MKRLVREFHAVVDRVDESLPTSVKQMVKVLSPRLVENFYRQLARFTADAPVDVRVRRGPLAGRSFRCSLRHQRSCYLGNFEPAKADLLRASLRAGDVLYDVGAHIGYFSLIAAGLVGETGAVLAFEPSLTNAEQFEVNLALNPDLAPRVRLERCAIADIEGQLRFQPGSNSYVGRLTTSAAGLEVPVTTVDAVVARTGRPPNFIKIDIEGAESRAFEGMGGTLSRDRPTLMVELHSAADLAVFAELLVRYEYWGRRLDEPGAHSIVSPWTGPAEYLAYPV